MVATRRSICRSHLPRLSTWFSVFWVSGVSCAARFIGVRLPRAPATFIYPRHSRGVSCPVVFNSCRFLSPSHTPFLLPTLRRRSVGSMVLVAVLTDAHRWKEHSKRWRPVSPADDCFSKTPPPRAPCPAFSASVVGELPISCLCPCRARLHRPLPWGPLQYSAVLCVLEDVCSGKRSFRLCFSVLAFQKAHSV